jgi:hypothetical protein
MAYGKKLPDDKTLARLVKQGLTNKAIGELYGATGEAVRQKLLALGLRQQERPSHAQYLPWRIRADHVGHVLARRLRAYSKRQQLIELSEIESRRLDEWLKFMDGGNRWGLPMSVHYDRNDPDGFWLEPRAATDRDYIAAPPD